MKKILSIFVLCFALVCANAQTNLFYEGFEGGVLPTGWTVVDNDGDGFGWDVYTSTSENTYNTADGIGCIGSLSYDNPTYSPLTPDNYLITPAIQLTNDATLHFFVAGQDEDYASENFSVYISTTGNSVADFTTVLTSGTSTPNHVEYTCNLSAYTGQTVYIAFRHHNSTDQYMLVLDEVSVTMAPTEASIFAPESINFDMVAVGDVATENAQVTAYHLTSGIVATTTDPFTVSADGTTYGSTATLQNFGGTLYVKFAPMAVLDYNEVITLSNDSVEDVTINVSGTGFECNAIELPFSTDFTNEALNNCWTVVDVNGDGDANGQGQFNLDAGNGVAVYYVTATDTLNPANDWLISPEFTLGENTLLSFDYLNYFNVMYYLFYGMSFPEKFAVYVIPSDTNYTGAIEVLPEQEVETFGSWRTAQIDLSEYEGESVRIGIKVTTDPANGYYFAVTDFAIGSAEPTLMTSADEGIEFNTGIAGTSTDVTPVLVYTLNINEDINVATNDPFAVSLDGTTFSSSVTIPANPALIVYDTIYVQYAPTTAGDFSDYVVLSTSAIEDSIEVVASAVECTAIDEFPFAESFSDSSETVSCWQVIDANHDGKTFEIGNAAAAYHYATGAADDWLISPEFILDGSEYLVFNARVQSSTYPERFHVDIIDENDVHTALVDTTELALTTPQTYMIPLNSFTGSYRIAFHCISDADMYNLFIENFSIEDATPAIVFNIDTLSFAGGIGVPTAAQVVEMTAISITDPIVATVAAPFEISADNINFANTLTITPTEAIEIADLYIRYNPTVVGENNETLTFTDGNVTSTIVLNGHAVDCSNYTLPYETDFSNEDMNACWTIIDANGDGNNMLGEISFITGDDAGESYIMYGYSATNAADDWAISPALTLGQNAAASFEYAVNSSSKAEKFSVYVIGEGQTYADGTKVLNTKTVTNTDWAFQAVDLSAYNGQTVQVAIHVESAANKYAIFFTNFRVANDAASIEEVAENNNISIYPNPANNVLNVSATSNISTVEVYTIAGQKVASMTANGMQAAVNTSNLSNGMYIIRINTENGVVNQKFTVVR